MQRSVGAAWSWERGEARVTHGGSSLPLPGVDGAFVRVTRERRADACQPAGPLYPPLVLLSPGLLRPGQCPEWFLPRVTSAPPTLRSLGPVAAIGATRPLALSPPPRELPPPNRPRPGLRLACLSAANRHVSDIRETGLPRPTAMPRTFEKLGWGGECSSAVSASPWGGREQQRLPCVPALAASRPPSPLGPRSTSYRASSVSISRGPK